MKLHSYILILIAAISCAEVMPDETPTQSAEGRTIHVNMPEITRTALGEGTENGVSLVWSKGDEIAVIENKGTTEQKSSIYRLVGEGGTSSGTFEYISGDAVSNVITDVVFPASSVENGYSVPKVQTYTEDSFDPSAMVMSWTRTREDEPIVLNHEASAFKITLLGSIEITSISVSYGRNNYILTCPEPVALTTEGKAFYITVPGSDTDLNYLFTIYPKVGIPMVRTAKYKLDAGKIGRLPTSEFISMKVGDFYADGMVFQVTREYAKVISLDEHSCYWAESSVSSVDVGTDSAPDEGLTNTIMFKERADFASFPAALWCINKSDDWYMPCRAEMKMVVENLGIKGEKGVTTSRQTEINNAIVAKGGTPFDYTKYYWTCCEDATDKTKARTVRLYDGGQSGYVKYGNNRPVRAVKKAYYASTTIEDTPTPPIIEGTDYDVFLLIGQSNMAGRGTMTIEDQNVFDENVFILNLDGNIEPAKNPLNAYSSIRKSLSMQGINPGFSFSKKIAAETGRKILLVVNARGGTAISSWKPTASPAAAADGAELKYYDEAIRRTKQAQKYGKLIGILWHQGEGNSGSPSNYLTHLKEIVEAFREDFNNPDLPFIAGEIAQWHTNASKFNPVIQGISAAIPNTDYVSTIGCTYLIDESDPHFSREGQILLGERYAEKILQYCYNK